MKSRFENIDDLLGKHLAGEASDEESRQIDLWLQEGEDNERYYNQVKTIFEKAGTVREWQEFDTDAAWNKLKSNLREHNSGVIPIQRNKNLYLWYQVAAAAVIIFGVGWFLLRPASSDTMIMTKEVVAETSAKSDTLPDGTDIFLNKKTQLVYAYDKKSSSHQVNLKGEAYFNIRNKKKEEFIVDAGGVFIRDIGTSFNVKAYQNSDEIEVLVEEGEVMFFTSDNPGINLKAGGKGVYNKKTKSFTIEQPDQNITAYKTKFFVFSKTELSTMVETLNHVYDKQLVVAENLKGCTMTVSFKDESIEEIAAVIAETLGLELNAQNNKIILDGEGCQ